MPAIQWCKLYLQRAIINEVTELNAGDAGDPRTRWQIPLQLEPPVRSWIQLWETVGLDAS